MTTRISKPLIVDYDPDVDILTLKNGTPASNAAELAEGVLVFMDDDDDPDPQIITIEDASKVSGAVFEPVVARKNRGCQISIASCLQIHFVGEMP